MTGFYEDTGIEGIVPTHSIDEHTDVEIGIPVEGQTLVYNAAAGVWTNQEVPAPSISLDELADVDVPTPTDGQFLAFNDLLGVWEPTTASATLALNDLTDVEAGAPNAGEVLTWDAGAGDWVPLPPNTGEGTVPDGSTAGQILRWNTGNFWEATSGLLVDGSGNVTIGGTLNGRNIVADGQTQDAHINDASIHTPATGFTAMEVVSALPGSPNPQTLYFVTG